MVKQRWVIGVTLFLSLALNFGLLAERFSVQKEPPQEWRGRMMERLQQLPQDEQQRLQSLFSEKKQDFTGKMQTLRHTRKTAFTYLRSGNYTRIEAEQKFAALREAQASMQQFTHSWWLDIADQLSPAQREQFFSKPSSTKPSAAAPLDNAP